MASERMRGLKAELDRLAERAESEDMELTTDDLAAREQAIGGFIAGGADLLDGATPFLWAYYRRILGLVTPEERAAYGVPEIADGADIWEHVEFHFPPQWLPGGGALVPGRGYLSFEGEVSWEPEHGLQLVVEDGRRVCKVGPYDGHLTVAHAYGDPSLLGVVFR